MFIGENDDELQVFVCTFISGNDSANEEKCARVSCYCYTFFPRYTKFFFSEGISVFCTFV